MPMEPYLKIQFAQLLGHVDASGRNRSRNTSAPSRSLDVQIIELMRTLPPQLRNRPWSMADLVQRLTGRYRAHPHAQHIGQSLRRLGWRRVRLWQGGAQGERVWLPGEHTAGY